MTNKELIEELQKLPPEVEIYLLQDEFGYYYPIDTVNLRNVGDMMSDPDSQYQSIDTGKHIDGIVIGY